MNSTVYSRTTSFEMWGCSMLFALQMLSTRHHFGNIVLYIVAWNNIDFVEHQCCSY